MTDLLDTEGTDLFRDYDELFTQARTVLSSTLDQLQNESGESRKAALASAEDALDDAKQHLGAMQLEVHNVPQSSRPKVNRRLRNHESDLDRLERQLKGLRDRNALFGGRYRDNPNGDEQLEQRQQLLSGTERLERSSGRLRESQRIANETEDIGRNTLADLGRQRETIEHTRSTLLESEGYTDRSNKTLKGMARRMATNKIVTIAIITVLVILILAVLVSKFR